MAVREYKCAFPWAQLGAFRVGLRSDSHSEFPNNNPIAMSPDVHGGSR